MDGLRHAEHHAMYLPERSHQETEARLDLLLQAVVDKQGDPAATARLVSGHVGALVMGLEQVPVLGLRVLYDASTVGLVRWLQLSLDAEIDTFLLQFCQSSASCSQCRQIWLMHLLSARAVIERWAWVTETEFLTR